MEGPSEAKCAEEIQIKDFRIEKLRDDKIQEHDEKAVNWDEVGGESDPSIDAIGDDVSTGSGKSKLFNSTAREPNCEGVGKFVSEDVNGYRAREQKESE